MHSSEHSCWRGGPRARGGGGEGLSHASWRSRRDSPSGGRARHWLRGRVMQMQGHEGLAGWAVGREGEGGGVSVWERACVRQRVSGDGCPAAHQRRQQPPAGRRGGRPEVGAACGAGRPEEPRRAGAAGRAGGSAVRRSAGKVRQRLGTPRGPEEMGRLLRRHDRDALLVSSLTGPPSCIFC